MTISRDQLLDLARRAGFSPTVWQLDLLEAMYTARFEAETTGTDDPDDGAAPDHSSAYWHVLGAGVKILHDDRQPISEWHPGQPPARPLPTWDTIAPGDAVLVRRDEEVMAAVVDFERDLAVGLNGESYVFKSDTSVEFLAWLTPDRKG